MGRGEGKQRPLASTRLGSDEGEIDALDAERLDDVMGHAAKDEETGGYGNDDDERAVGNLLAWMRNTGKAQGLTEDELVDRAESLYVLMCRAISKGGASQEQLAQWAQILGEEPAELSERLAPGLD